MATIRRNETITQGHMDNLATISNVVFPGKNFTFTGASSSLWFSEYNRIRANMYSSSYNIGPATTTSNYSSNHFWITGSHAPYFTKLSTAQATSGPWVLKTGQNTIAGNVVDWPVDEVEYWYVDRGSSQSLTSSANYDDSYTLGNVLNNWFFVSTIYLVGYHTSASKTFLRIGGSQDGVLTFAVPLTIGVAQRVGSPSGGPNLTIGSELPNYTLNIRTQSLLGMTSYAAEFTYSQQTISPGLYSMSVVVGNDSEWLIPNTGLYYLTNTNHKNTIKFSITNTASETKPAVVNDGNYGAKRILCNVSTASSNGWPFGLYSPGYGQTSFGATFRDMVDNNTFTSASYDFISQFQPSTRSYTGSAAGADSLWVGKTIPPIKEYADLDTVLPYTTLNNNGSGSGSTKRTASNYGGTLIDPSIAYGLSAWPITQYSTSAYPNRKFLLATGSCIYSTLITVEPTLNSDGIYTMVPLPTSQSVTVGWFNSGSFKILDTYTIPSGSTSYYTESFYPVFTPTSLSNSGSHHNVIMNANHMPSYVLIQAGVSGGQDLKVPWLNNAQFPIMASHYNGVYTWLTQSIQ